MAKLTAKQIEKKLQDSKNEKAERRSIRKSKKESAISKQGNNVSYAKKMQDALIKAKREIKSQAQLDKQLAEIEANVLDSIIFEVEVLDAQVKAMSLYLDNWALIVETMQGVAKLEEAEDIPTEVQISMNKEVITDLVDTFSTDENDDLYIQGTSDLPILEVVNVLTHRRKIALSETLPVLHKSIDEFDAYRNCNVAVNEEGITTIDEGDNDKPWYKLQGNNGIKLSVVKTNQYDWSKAYKLDKFASQVEKEEKAKKVI